MRKQSNLNPVANIAVKPRIIKAFCIICNHTKSDYESGLLVDCIDNICLTCRDEGHTLDTFLAVKVEEVKRDNECLDCDNITQGRAKRCEPCAVKRKNKMMNLYNERKRQKTSGVRRRGKICESCKVSKPHTARAFYCLPCKEKIRKEVVKRVEAKQKAKKKAAKLLKD